MSIYCDTGHDDDGGGDWWWMTPSKEATLTTKRSRKCCSCREKISVGDMTREVRRFRHPTEREEMRIASDEIKLASWYLCEACGDLADSLAELDFCYSLGDESLKKQIADYRSEEEDFRNRQIAYLAKKSARLESQQKTSVNVIDSGAAPCA